MEFVVHVLETIFQKSPAEAYRIMMAVHVNGNGIAGIYPWEVAETKVDAVTSMARGGGFPLRAVTEGSVARRSETAAFIRSDCDLAPTAPVRKCADQRRGQSFAPYGAVSCWRSSRRSESARHAAPTGQPELAISQVAYCARREFARQEAVMPRTTPRCHEI